MTPELDGTVDVEVETEPDEVTGEGVEVAADAATALIQLDEVYARWVAGVRRLGADGLERPVGPGEGEWAAFPYADLVLHISREAIHHGAEILLLRDLYRHRKDVQ